MLTCEGLRRGLKLLVEAHVEVVAGDSTTGRNSRLRRSWWSDHLPDLRLSENLTGIEEQI